MMESRPMGELKRISWEFVLLLTVTLAGWAFTAGTMFAHLDETQKRLDKIEVKVDAILENQFNRR